jgi:hypothetical protein
MLTATRRFGTRSPATRAAFAVDTRFDADGVVLAEPGVPSFEHPAISNAKREAARIFEVVIVVLLPSRAGYLQRLVVTVPAQTPFVQAAPPLQSALVAQEH